MINFSSNDYLGLANHPALKEAAIQAIQKYGAGAGASRLVCGSMSPHHVLETKLATFKGTEAALTFSTGYATALGAVCSLVGKNDVVLLDRLAHACLIDAARLSGATMRTFKHNDLADLRRKLAWARRRLDASKDPVSAPESSPQILILTESVFSMGGDHAPLKDMAELKEEFGAWLMIDEAHATGLFGKNLRGRVEECGVEGAVEIQMGTLGKSLGASGGYICGPRLLIDYLVNRARAFIFSTAPVPCAAAAAATAIELLQQKEGRERRDRCLALMERIKNHLAETGFPAESIQSPIIPLIVGDAEKAIQFSQKLADQGILVPAIRYPSVPRGSARLRLTVSAAHTDKDLERLFAALKQCSPVRALSHAT